MDLKEIDSIPIEKLREQVMDRLTEHYSRENLSMEEFERRAGEATKARTQTALYVLVSDLPAMPRDDMMPAAREAAYPRADTRGYQVASSDCPDKDVVFCVFGGASRKGIWNAPRKLDAMCVFGGAEIDFRKAAIPPEGVRINVMAIFGGVDIIIPPGLRVQTKGIGIMGGFDHAQAPDAAPDAPVIVIEGLAVFGGVDVKIRA